MLNRTTSVVIIVVGLALAFSLWLGLSAIAAGLREIPISPSGSTDVPPTLVALSGNRFVVVHDYDVQVFQVDAKGHVHELDEINSLNMKKE